MAQIAGTPAVTPPAAAGGVTGRHVRVGDRVFRGSSLVIGACLILLLFVILGVLAKGGADAFKTIYESIFGGDCGCGDRQAKLNAAFPYSEQEAPQ